MSERWARAVLSTYRWAGVAVYPVVGDYMAARAEKGTPDRARRRERYGFAQVQRPLGPLVWVHAAGEGETAAVTGLVDAMLARDIAVVLTTATAASAGIAAERLGDRVIHQFVPLDVKPAVSRFLDHWRPDLAIMAESEIWPITVLELGARRVPQLLVNGRMSDKAFASWSRRHNIAEALFENFAMVVAQSETDAERFRQLGARPVSVGGSLRTDSRPPPADEVELSALRDQIGPRACWSALRTMPGEDPVIIAAHRLLKSRYPEIVTVVAPADPRRADGMEQEYVSAGLVVSRRARGDRLTAKTDVLIGDKPAESGLHARLSQVAFIGGSLCPTGAHNPLDAVMCGCAVLSGANIEYHRELYAPLIDGGGVKLVKDPTMLAGAVNFLLKNSQVRNDMARAGARAVAQMRGALTATLQEIEPFVHPLVVQARLQENGAGLG